MDFNKKIAAKILSDLQNAKMQNLSLKNLENNIRKNFSAIDSPFQNQLEDISERILSKIDEHQQKQYSATLNTSMEGSYDETLPIGNLFDSEIDYLEKYTRS